jgi:hypothetical protein
MCNLIIFRIVGDLLFGFFNEKIRHKALFILLFERITIAAPPRLCTTKQVRTYGN